MGPHHTLHVDILVVLLLVASAVAIAVKWVRVPYSIALVIVGLAIGVSQVSPPIEMTPELILLVFLPALLFEASWNLHLDELRANWVSVSVLSTLGVVVSMAVVGCIMNRFAGMAIGTAFLFGALISATDPISVLALFRKIGIDKRLTMILEGESLFNDGTAAVLFKLILALTLAKSTLSLDTTLGQFCVEVAGGVGVGCVLGMAASTITRYFDDHLLEITLTTILAYGSFLVAEQMHVSPVISVVAAGIVMGNYGRRLPAGHLALLRCRRTPGRRADRRLRRSRRQLGRCDRQQNVHPGLRQQLLISCRPAGPVKARRSPGLHAIGCRGARCPSFRTMCLMPA